MARRLSTQTTVVDISVSNDEMPLLCATEQDETSRDKIPARFADQEVDGVLLG